MVQERIPGLVFLTSVGECPCAGRALLVALWQVFVASCFHVHLAAVKGVLLGLTCWMVYATDYVIGGVRAHADDLLQARHEF